jgi:hypothetical protein
MTLSPMARYENEDALVQEIEELDQRDNYVFRWRGTIEIPAAGRSVLQPVPLLVKHSERYGLEH